MEGVVDSKAPEYPRVAYTELPVRGISAESAAAYSHAPAPAADRGYPRICRVMAAHKARNPRIWTRVFSISQRRPIGSNENMPWVVVTIPDELEKNGQPQNEKMKFESSKHETKLSMKLTAQVQARILSKTHRV